MKKILLIGALLWSITVNAESISPDWYVLERGCTVGVIKPGVNDLTLFLATNNNKPLDKEGVAKIESTINFTPGYVVLIYARENGYYIATDMEGRNLVIKGGVTKGERGTGCGVAYLKDNVTTPAGNTIKKGTFVWIKEHKNGQENATIQTAGNQTAQVAFNKLYDINATTVDMAKTVKFKTVLN